MEWTLQQIVSLVIGIVVAGIILYFVITHLTAPEPQVPTQVLPIFFALGGMKRTANDER